MGGNPTPTGRGAGWAKFRDLVTGEVRWPHTGLSVAADAGSKDRPGFSDPSGMEATGPGLSVGDH